jgi:acetyltransferase-like isoleucine patch superfamily enzyme
MTARYRKAVNTFTQLWYDSRSVARARWFLRAADEVGMRVRLDGRPRVINRGRMIIGERVRLDSSTSMIDLVADTDGFLEIEASVFINVGCSIGATRHIRIGAGSQLGPQCMLMDNAFHHVEAARRHDRPDSRPIVLEPNVWLGARTIVLPGVTIGQDSVIGAGSIVNRDVPSGCLAAGAPARVLRSI